MILDLIELSASLIATLNEDLASFVEMEGGSVASSSGAKRDLGAGAEECSLSCDDSERSVNFYLFGRYLHWKFSYFLERNFSILVWILTSRQVY